MRIPRDKVDAILQAADILDVVGEYVQLKRRGANYVGLSPFQQERTPSFTVSPAKGIFKDFSSGKGGDAVRFIMEVEGLSYPEALRLLARKYGIVLEEAYDPEAAAQDHLRDSILIANKFAFDFYRQQLTDSDEGRRLGLTYLQERGFDDATLQIYGVGYAPDAWSAMSDAALRQQYKPDVLVEAGLATKSDRYPGRITDRFRGRVMFPIRTPSGQVVGFGGRVLKTEAQLAKYINTTETPVYKKGHLLYGIYEAKDAIRKAQEVILVEGYTDVLRLHQAGIGNVVASSGTALTLEQARLLKRYAPNVLVLYDGDLAGIKASLRGIDILLTEGLNVRALLLPEGHDPDSYIRAFGGAAFSQHASGHASDFIDFTVEVLTGGQGLPQQPAARLALVQQIAHTVALLPDALQRSLYCGRVAERLQIDEQLFISAVNLEIARVRKQQESQSRLPANRNTPSAPGPSATGQAPAIPLPEGVAPPADSDAHYHIDIPPPGYGPVGGFGITAPVVQPAPDTTPDDLARMGLPPTYAQEYEVCRLLLMHYDKRVVMEDEWGGVESFSLPNYMGSELDQLPFRYEPFQHIRDTVLAAAAASEPLPTQRLLHELGDEVAALTTTLLTPKHELSEQWERVHDTVVPKPDQDLLLSADEAMNHLRLRHILLLMRENMQALKHAVDPDEVDTMLERHQKLEIFRAAYCQSLGIVIHPDV